MPTPGPSARPEASSRPAWGVKGSQVQVLDARIEFRGKFKETELRRCSS